MVTFLEAQVGDPYDWAAIADDAVGRKLPWDTLLNRHRKNAHDCSGLVTDALLIGGVQIPHQALPETPNDLLQALQAIAGVSLHQGAPSPRKQIHDEVQL